MKGFGTGCRLGGDWGNACVSESPHEVVPASPAEQRDDPRAAVRAGLTGYLTEVQVAQLLDQVLSLTKTTHVSCPSCKKRNEVTIPDARAVSSSLTELLVAGFGRPGEQRRDQEVVVRRTVEYVCEHGHPCPKCVPEAPTTIRSHTPGPTPKGDH